MNHKFNPPGLIALFEDYCVAQKFSVNTKTRQRDLLNQLISYMEMHSFSTFTPEIGKSFIIAATEGLNEKV